MPTETVTRSYPSRYPFDEPEVEILRGIEVPKANPSRRVHGQACRAYFSTYLMSGRATRGMFRWSGACT